jgi:hypothetical protein
MTKDEALKLARDWIAERPADRPVSAGKMISIIDRALAQPAQEPVAWSWVPSEDWGTYFTENASKAAVMRERGLEVRPLYTAPQPRPWVGLTDDQFLEAARLAEDGNYLVALQRIQQCLRRANT